MERAEYDKRVDGTESGVGFLGKFRDTSGKVFSEYTVQVNIDDEVIEIPTMVPTLSIEDIQVLSSLEGAEVPEDIVEKAVQYAMSRQEHGLSLFADEEDEEIIPDLRISKGL